MIKHIQITTRHQGHIFRDYEPAHRFCQGRGVEFGAAAHNPFNMPDCLNIAPETNFDMYKAEQVRLCGSYAKVDLWGKAENPPLQNEVVDYIITSHVFEHIADPIAAIYAWDRILSLGGIVLTIIPHRNALASDVGRPLSNPSEMLDRHLNGSTPTEPEHHYYVWDASIFKTLVHMTGVQWVPLFEETPDSKAGNGFCVIYRKVK